jgi:hypothetical protein
MSLMHVTNVIKEEVNVSQDDKGELDCLGAKKGINIGITQQYLGIHIYLHENAYKFLFPFTLYLFLTHVLLLFLFHAIIHSYKAIALADLDECQI